MFTPSFHYFGFQLFKNINKYIYEKVGNQLEQRQKFETIKI